MGRPKGSKNKPKVNSTPTNNTVESKNTSNTKDTLTYISGSEANSPPKKRLTAAEKQELMNQQRFEQASQAFKKIRDVTKTTRQTTITSYNKDKVIQYLQNVSNYEKELRNLSRYLFYRSQVYFRLIMYNATMFDLNARYVIPEYNPTKENNAEKTLKSYYQTLQVLDRMDLQHQLLPMLINNFIEDVYYGCCWIDETGIFILQIPPEYCKINGKYYTGDFSFEVDMSNYKKFEDILEFLGEPLSTMYQAYGGNNQNKWQQMPDEYALCTKARLESWETVVPIYSGLFIDLINLLDLADIQAVADEQQIYKLITATIPTISGAKGPDEWAVDVDLALEYYEKMVESLPPYIGAAITPIPLDTISFSDDQATDTTKIQNATKSILNTSGGAQILNSSTISGAEAFRSATKADTEFAISSLLGQIQGWTNRMLSYQVSNPAKVKFFEVSSYTKDAFKESMQKDLNYGYPNVLAINSLNGFSEMDTLALNYLENEVLHLSDKFKALQTSSTLSSKESGGQEKSDSQLTDEGAETKDAEKNKI